MKKMIGANGLPGMNTGELRHPATGAQTPPQKRTRTDGPAETAEHAAVYRGRRTGQCVMDPGWRTTPVCLCELPDEILDPCESVPRPCIFAPQPPRLVANPLRVSRRMPRKPLRRPSPIRPPSPIGSATPCNPPIHPALPRSLLSLVQRKYRAVLRGESERRELLRARVEVGSQDRLDCAAAVPDAPRAVRASRKPLRAAIR